MSIEVEYESAYLVKSLPEGIYDAKSVLISDYFVPDTANHAHLRLRQKDDSYVITKKYPVTEGDSSIQFEHTIELNKEEFDALKKCSTKSFVKRRYFMELVGHPAEIDVYLEKLKGLVVVEFEFNSELEKNAFKMPDFAIADVSQEEATAGGFVSGKSIDDIMPLLKKYGYKKLEVNS